MSEDTEPVEIHICDSMVELALLRALFDHRQIQFSVDEDELGFHVCVLPADVERARAALGDRGFGEESEEDDPEEEGWDDADVDADAASPAAELPPDAFRIEKPASQTAPETEQGYLKKLLRSWTSKKG